MNVRPAPDLIVLAVEKRLKGMPGARLVPKTCKLCAIPGTLFDCTTFIVSRPRDGLEHRFFTAEMGAGRADVPHVYFTKEITGLPPKEITRTMIEGLQAMAQRIHSDPRFKANIIQLGSARIVPARLTKVNGSK